MSPKLATAKIRYEYTTSWGTKHHKHHSMGCTEDDSLKTIREHFENFVNGNEFNKKHDIKFHSVEIISDIMN